MPIDLNVTLNVQELHAAGAIIDGLGAKEGDLILLMGADWKTAVESLGAVRTRLGKDLGLARPDEFRFCWVIDFPFLVWNEDENRWDPSHHLFTAGKSVDGQVAGQQEPPIDLVTLAGPGQFENAG